MFGAADSGQVAIQVLAHRSEIGRLVQMAVVEEILAAEAAIGVGVLIRRDRAGRRTANRAPPTVIAEVGPRFLRKNRARKPLIHYLLGALVLADSGPTRAGDRRAHPAESAAGHGTEGRIFPGPSGRQCTVFLPPVT